MKTFSKAALAVVLCFSMTLAACSVSQFEAVLNEIAPAISTIIQIIAISRGIPANLAPATKIAADVAGIEIVYGDYQNAAATAKPGLEAQINDGFSVLQADLGTVFSVAQVSNPNTQAKISALVSLVETGVSIAEAAIPSSAIKFGAKAPANMNADAMVNSFDSILVAKTGDPAVDSFTHKHRLHYHSKAVRILSLGHVQ